MGLKWETIEAGITRARVHRGWLVQAFTIGYGIAMTFVPDEEHMWEVDKE